MHKPSSCFADLSRAELAHVAHCQKIALERRLAVVSSGVFAAEAGELAGLHFWLVASPSAPVASPVLVWLSGRRLCCGCKRRRSDRALTCCHAQAVRLWLLAAAGVAVPVSSSSSVGASAPTPAPAAEPAAELAPEVTPVAPCPGCEELAPVATLATWGTCLDCLDLMAEAEHTRIIRCRDCGQQAAVAETANGAFCQDCIASRQSDYGRASDERLGASLP